MNVGETMRRNAAEERENERERERERESERTETDHKFITNTNAQESGKEDNWGCLFCQKREE